MRCNRVWEIQIPKEHYNVLWNIFNALTLFFGGSGVFTRKPDLYCPTCKTNLKIYKTYTK
jgi:hypothetical protein